MWPCLSMLEEKPPGNTIVKGNGSKTHLGGGKQVIREMFVFLLCAFSILSH